MYISGASRCGHWLDLIVKKPFKMYELLSGSSGMKINQL